LPGEPRCVTVTRTVRLRLPTPEAASQGLAVVANRGKAEVLSATREQWQRATAFYVDLFLSHPGVFERRKTAVIRRGPKAGQTREVPWSNQDLLTWAESVTVPTRAHPDVPADRDFRRVCPRMPVEIRRAAIRKAIGEVRSYLTNHARWEKGGRKGREPKPPRPHPHLTAYAGMVDFKHGFVRLTVFSDGQWVGRNYPVLAPPHFYGLLAESGREKARIAAERAEQNARMAAEGRRERTEEEKGRLEPQPGVWVAGSPTLLEKPGGWELHVPFAKRVPIAGKAEERRLAEPELKVGTVDLNERSALGAAWEGRRCRGIRPFWHAREGAEREKALQKVARKQRRSGRPVKGERGNAGLWRYIRALDEAVAWQVAAAIVAWAVTLGLQVLVFEYLRRYRPERGLSWSRRVNRKRSYWLRGQVLAHVRHLALCHGILTVERNPAWTSRTCPRCSHLGARFSPDGRGYPSRFRCGQCGWKGDANVVAALNLKRKWDRTFRYPSAEERDAERSRRRKAGAAASREGSWGVGLPGVANARSADAPAA
jgi:putative transposase